MIKSILRQSLSKRGPAIASLVLGLVSFQNAFASSDYSSAVSLLKSECTSEANEVATKNAAGKNVKVLKKQAYVNCIDSDKLIANVFEVELNQIQLMVRSKTNFISTKVTPLDVNTRITVGMKLNDLNARIEGLYVGSIVFESKFAPKLTALLASAHEAASNGDAQTLISLTSKANAELETFKKELN